MNLACCKGTACFSSFLQINVVLLQDVQTVSGAHPFSIVYQGSFPKVKQPGREVAYSPSHRTGVNSKECYAFVACERTTLTSLILQAFMVSLID